VRRCGAQDRSRAAGGSRRRTREGHRTSPSSPSMLPRVSFGALSRASVSSPPAASRRSIGIAVFSGMIGSTCLAVCLFPPALWCCSASTRERSGAERCAVGAPACSRRPAVFFDTANPPHSAAVLQAAPKMTGMPCLKWSPKRSNSNVPNWQGRTSKDQK